MIRRFLTLALRTFYRRKGYTAVNVLGLTVGLGCCALVLVFLQYEMTYDTHHRHADRTYRLLTTYDSGDVFSSIRFKDYFGTDAEDQPLLVNRMVASIPAIEQATNFEILDTPLFVTTPDGDTFESDRQLYTNTGRAFADVFTFDRVAGDPLGDALAAPGSAILTQTTARTYFGDADPIGQTLTVGETEATVRAVIADPPSNSRIRFDLALNVNRIENWAAYHYVRLTDGADPDAVASQVSTLMDELFPNRLERSEKPTQVLQALPSIHLADRALYDDTPHRNPDYLWAFGAIGLLILVITTINYANLALALYAGRNAEIGVRKAVGGHRRQIATQFLVEAGLLALLCVPLALIACSSALPLFNDLMGTDIASARLLQPVVLGAMTILAVVTGLAAGSYPALVMARKQVVDLFDRGLSSGGRRTWSLRHGLIAIQFAVLIGLGSLTWIAYGQLGFMQEGDLGYETDAVLKTNFRGDSTAYQRFRQRLKASPAIAEVGMGIVPRQATNRGTFGITGEDVVYEGGTYRRVDVYWFDVMGIEHPVVESMKEEGPGAPVRTLLNQTAADVIQTPNPIGEQWAFVPNEPDPTYRPPIAGVMNDVHINSMRREISPELYRVDVHPRFGYNVVLRFVPGRLDEARSHLQAVWDDEVPNTPLRTSFLSQTVAELYEQERRFGTLSAALALLAILMAAIGLASLVAYLTRMRLKEIGVRKALGGSTSSIVRLLNTEYVQIVGVAFLVGAPLAWWVAQAWLEQFAYRIDVSPLVFVGTGLGALAVAVMAVSTQAVRAARIDPAQVLRSE